MIVGRFRRERGQGLVEFAVIFPLFAFFLFAIIDGGLLMGRYNNINNSVKEAARLGAVAGDTTEIINRAKDQAHGGLDTASTNCADFDNAAVKHVICVEWISGPNGEPPGQPGASVRVRIKYRYEALTPIFSIVGAATVGEWDVKVCAVQRQEQSISPVPNAVAGATSC